MAQKHDPDEPVRFDAIPRILSSDPAVARHHGQLISFFVLRAEAVAPTHRSRRRFRKRSRAKAHDRYPNRLASIAGIASTVDCSLVSAASIRLNSSGPCTYTSMGVTECQYPFSESVLTNTWGDSHAQAFAPVTLVLARYVRTVNPSATAWSRGIHGARACLPLGLVWLSRSLDSTSVRSG